VKTSRLRLRSNICDKITEDEWWVTLMALLFAVYKMQADIEYCWTSVAWHLSCYSQYSSYLLFSLTFRLHVQLPMRAALPVPVAGLPSFLLPSFPGFNGQYADSCLRNDWRRANGAGTGGTETEIGQIVCEFLPLAWTVVSKTPSNSHFCTFSTTTGALQIPACIFHTPTLCISAPLNLCKCKYNIITKIMNVA
jgi:hypothetical protein